MKKLIMLILLVFVLPGSVGARIHMSHRSGYSFAGQNHQEIAMAQTVASTVRPRWQPAISALLQLKTIDLATGTTAGKPSELPLLCLPLLPLMIYNLYRYKT